MGHAADAGVHARASQRFGIVTWPTAPFTRLGPPEPHETDVFHHDDDVAQRRQIGAARDARPHHRRNLRDVQFSAHQRVVVENARRAILARENPS